VHLRQLAKKVRAVFLFFFPLDPFIAFLGASQQGEFKNAIKHLEGKPMSKTKTNYTQNGGGGGSKPGGFPLVFFNRVFRCFSAENMS
jgi:hypothetical protein